MENKETEMKSNTSLQTSTSGAARGFWARHLAASLVAMAAILFAPAALAQSEQRPAVDRGEATYSEEEIVREAGDFFGDVSKGLADAVHSIFKRYGEPNAYIKGEEAGGAFVVGLRYGQGELVMKNGTRQRVYWQGPSAGWDFGGNAVKNFTLVYNLPNGEAIYQRFPGVEGSAFLIGGIAINYQQRDDIVLAPMRAGVGLRLGASVGYLKYTKSREWLPF
ncbi:MAG: DUF1134 domain-containing protein [Alphaproteobacteria bacterium HGW-Alphaproteobacteria-11]|nr:MAG: DUF1134 domain-containing protein [Alphaproteobacteria bacterium HGW-Alphaproteobacteria-11]